MSLFYKSRPRDHEFTLVKAEAIENVCGLCRVLARRGGLRARIVTGGVVRVGDAVEVLT